MTASQIQAKYDLGLISWDEYNYLMFELECV